MLCWGHSDFGQLGINRGSINFILEPIASTFHLARCVQQVACGENHSVFLLDDGRVYSCGENGAGQLGHDHHDKEPGQVNALASERIVHVACGRSYSVALNNQGQIFSWGAGSDGQLGHSTTEQCIPVPRFIKKLNQQKILQVSCGNQHCLALSDDGQLFTWGQNSHGQLGLGQEFSSQSSPQRVKSLEGIPVAQVTAGGFHSFALSLSGAVFGWGKNNSGQLGLNDEKVRESPCHVKPLRTQKVVYISCGEEHTAVLTKTGGLFTFGAGGCGQLGHDSLHNEINPRRVLELMGSEVSQIACGRQHTIAYVPSSGLLYAFGCGEHGQLGIGHTSNVICPTLVKGKWTTHCIKIPPKIDPSSYNIIKHIFCGWAKTFVLCSNPEKPEPAEDFRFYQSKNYTSCINDETINDWRQKVMENSNSNTMNGIVQTLSSSACWNGSFLEKKNDEHFKTSPKIPGIDMLSIKVLFEKLMNSQHSRLLEQIHKGFESFLIPQLSSSPPDVEAMRIYLILPEFPLLQDSKYYITLTLPLAMAILKLDTNPSKVLDNWWSWVCPNYFFKLIDLYKGAVVYLLTGRKTLLIPVLFASYITAALRLLEKLHKVNVKVRHVEHDQFYIPEISSLVDIQEDYLMWFLNQAGLKMRASIMQDSVTLCSYPFVFDAQAKTKMLQTDAELQMQCFVEHNWFHLIGIMCGLAIYNSTVVDLHFPLVLYKKLLNVPATLEDLKELSPTEGRSLQQLLDYPGEDVEETFCINFTICRQSYGLTEMKALVPGGDKMTVRKDNRQEYVDAYVNYVFNQSVQEWYEAFSTGFLKVCGGKVLELFQPSELRAMVVGSSNYNWQELEESADYKGDFSADHPTVRMFWETFHEFPLEKKKRFLLFLTGSDRIPIYGMSSLHIIIQPTSSGEDYLPVAHTCYNLLDLPKYSSKETLRQRLNKAIDHYEGFSLA
ncbi:putative E3 ubiquitin-protein ligase HERC3 [Mantella aurantiaca]